MIADCSQNAAPVEQSAAAALALERQAPAMDEGVTFFRYDDAQAASGANLKSLVISASYIYIYEM